MYLNIIVSYQGHHQRVIDTVPQFIDGIFVRGTARELQTFLIQRLELESEGAFERCKGYISDES
jgi:hypothetical protein